MIQRDEIVSIKAASDGRTRWMRVGYLNRIDSLAVLHDLTGGGSEIVALDAITTY